MPADPHATAEACLRGAETNTMSFPAIVAALNAAGFEGYAVDLRRAGATYYRPDGETIDLPAHRPHAAVAPAFAPDKLAAAIREAQVQGPGYTYLGFCEQAAAAGVAGYHVSFSGRRAVYHGRSGETYVEPFPQP